MGGVMSRIEDVVPAARSTVKSPATQPATQVENLKLFLQDDRRARSNHVRQLIRIPVRQADAPGRFAVMNSPGIRRSMDSIMFFREADPYGADGAVRSGGQHCAALLRDRVPKEVRVIVEPRIV